MTRIRHAPHTEPQTAIRRRGWLGISRAGTASRTAPLAAPIHRCVRQAGTQALALLALIGFVGCATITDFDQNSLTAAKALKEQSSVLILAADSPAAGHAADIASLKRALASELAYERGKNKHEVNLITVSQWELFIKKVDEFVAKWEAPGAKFTSLYLKEKAAEMEKLADEIIRMESGKPR